MTTIDLEPIVKAWAEETEQKIRKDVRFLVCSVCPEFASLLFQTDNKGVDIDRESRDYLDVLVERIEEEFGKLQARAPRASRVIHDRAWWMKDYQLGDVALSVSCGAVGVAVVTQKLVGRADAYLASEASKRGK